MNCIKCQKPTGATWKTLCYSCFKNRPVEEVRAYRQAKLDRKVTRFRIKAKKLNTLGEQEQAPFRSYHGDISFFTQPASPSSPFGRQRQRIYNKYDTGRRMQNEAQGLIEKADWLEKTGAVVKGDAERKRQAQRETLDKLIFVGSRINDIIFGNGLVMKVNKKTYTIKYDKSGNTWTQEKTFCRPLAEGGEKQ